MSHTMDPQRWQQIRAAFDEIAALDAESREGRLAELAVHDPDLRNNVEALLGADTGDDRITRRVRFELATDVMQRQRLEHLEIALAGHYDVERELARGGMGSVHLAEDLKHRRKVAIKVLSSELAQSVGAERFLREIEISAKLAHPHILPLLDSGDAGGVPYYAMPYVPGGSLRERLNREKQLSLDDAVRIACEVAAALDYAHRSGVVHRDVKPENILLEDGNAVVADFGIARAISRAAGDTLTSVGQAIGTPAYMSPEQASGETELDARTDVYSLACVLYEMLAGEPPFVGSNPQAVIAKRMAHDAPSVRILRVTVPESLDRVLQRALSRAPADRYATADSFRRAIAAAADRRDAQHGMKTASAEETRRPSDAAAVGSIAVLPFENLSADPQQEYFVAGMHAAVVAELSEIAALRVASRTSVARFAGVNETIAEIARDLKVDAVMEGSVLAIGDRVRLHVQLMQASPTERRVWGQTYERDQQDVLSLHREIARAVAEETRLSLTSSEQARLAERRSVNPEAYRHYLIGNFHCGRYTELAFRKALEHYAKAIAIDPAYAPAYAAQAVAYIELGSWASSQPPDAVKADAKLAALAAIERDPNLAEAHIALARIMQLFEWDWSTADAEFRRGLELSPNSGFALTLYSNYLVSIGHFDEAATISRRAIELDPLAPHAYAGLAWAMDHSWRDEEALEYYSKGFELSPNDVNYLLLLAEFYGQRDRHADASDYAEQSEKLLGRAGPPAYLGRVGYVYAITGRHDDARRILNHILALSQTYYVPACVAAWIWAPLGEIDRALDALEQGYTNREVVMVWVNERRIRDVLRGHPRFEALLRRMNFPD